jgi:hypothetical protein
MIDIIRTAKSSRVEGEIYVKNLSFASPPTTGQPFGNASFSGVVPLCLLERSNWAWCVRANHSVNRAIAGAPSGKRPLYFHRQILPV